MFRNLLLPADELARCLVEAGYQLVAPTEASAVRPGEFAREVIFMPKPAAGTGRTRRRWRFDFVFAGKVAVEVDGGIWARQGARKCPICGQILRGRHAGGRGFQADCEKMNAATVLGWRVFRVTPQMVHEGEALRLARCLV